MVQLRANVREYYNRAYILEDVVHLELLKCLTTKVAENLYGQEKKSE